MADRTHPSVAALPGHRTGYPHRVVLTSVPMRASRVLRWLRCSIAIRRAATASSPPSRCSTARLTGSGRAMHRLLKLAILNLTHLSTLVPFKQSSSSGAGGARTQEVGRIMTTEHGKTSLSRWGVDLRYHRQWRWRGAIPTGGEDVSRGIAGLTIHQPVVCAPSYARSTVAP